MKKLLYLTLIFGLTFNLYSQSIINKNLYIANPVQLNPAYMGNQGKLFLGFQSSLSGSNKLNLPTYSSINIHSSIYENLAFGGDFLFESQGLFSLTMADAGLAYQAKIDANQKLRFGMTVGFIKQSLNTSSISTNPFVDQNDPFLTGDLYNQTNLKLGAGIVYQYGNLELGIGSPYLFRGGETINKEANITVGYMWSIPQNRIKINPSLLYQIKDADTNLYDINMRGIYDNKVSLLVGYRSNQSINVTIGVMTGLFDLGYNFNTVIGDLKEINNNNHEILLAFTIKKKVEHRITNKTRASQKYRKVNKGEMNNSLSNLQSKYDSLALISSKKQDEEGEKRALVEKELEKIQTEMTIIQESQKRIETKKVEEVLLSDEIAIEPGNYVVISTCKSLLCAEEFQASVIKKGENHSKIILNKEKGFYYIITSRFTNIKEALKSMERKRKSGYPDSWVLIYK